MKKMILMGLISISLNGKTSEIKVGKLNRLCSAACKTLKLATVPIKFTYNNSDKIVSVKTLKFIAIVGAPFFYFNPDILQELSRLGADGVVKMNGLIARGILEGLMSNPAALASLAALLTAQSTATSFIKGFGEKMGGLLLTIFTLG